MKKRRLGRTGLEVSEVGFGCGMLAGLMTQPDGAVEQRKAIERALERGINYFDTAPVYGDTVSETSLGRALNELGARPIIATKVALVLDDLNDVYGAVLRSVQGSLERLGRIDLIQLHNRVAPSRAPKPDIGSGAQMTVADVLGPRGVVEAFAELKRRGDVAFSGCCAFGGDPACVRQLIDSDAFDTVLVHYSEANPTAWQHVPGVRDYAEVGARAVKRGMGVVAIRVLEAGKAPDPSQALRYVLNNAEVSTALIGFSDVAQVEAAVQIAKND